MSTILVIDDNPSQTRLMCMLVYQLGLECHQAYSGHDGIAIAKEKQPDLIIMDWVMPVEKLTGTMTVQRLKSDPMTHHIPVVACSAVDNLQEAIDMGCAEYIHKPYNPEAFRQMIKRYI